MSEQVALITGGASGFGRGLAHTLSERGVKVVVVDVDEDGGRAVADATGGRFVHADVSDLEQNRAAVAAAVDAFGGLDMAFLNAGIVSGIGVGDEFTLEAYRRAMGVNLDGVVFGVHAVLPVLKARGGGAIVATASLAGLTAVPMDPLYAANKHAVVGLVRSLGPALAQDGIRINAVCPGFAETAIITEIRSGLLEAGLPIIPVEQVTDAVVELLDGDMTGECWYVQAGRENEAFRFRNIPGPRPVA